ncbi:MAG: hypothetical protein GY874_01960 [Desulfobacteraceae bacterium]|nr:hypothetical protein [Desulfobacteraceae bacterium]
MADEIEKKLLLDQYHYRLLKRCSDREDMTEWNKWRKENPKIEILLGCSDFERANLQGANLQGVWLLEANLQEANLQGAWLLEANLQDANLQGANLQEAWLLEANLQGANLKMGKLQEAFLGGVDLEGADLQGAKLQKAEFLNANLQGAQLNFAQVDGMTTIMNCEFDKRTDFTGVGLDAVIIDPGIKAGFKNNIRRKNWKIWLRKGSFVKKIFKRLFVWPFWLMTNYGSSTLRITYCFFGSAIFFGLLYFWLELAEKGLVYNLDIDKMPYWHTLLRAMYFSVVTMTTLGFGDIYALNTSYWGHISLMIQVILGYVLLGALVTRLGILFTNEAPAAKPTSKKRKRKKREKGRLDDNLLDTRPWKG